MDEVVVVLLDLFQFARVAAVKGKRKQNREKLSVIFCPRIQIFPVGKLYEEDGQINVFFCSQCCLV